MLCHGKETKRKTTIRTEAQIQERILTLRRVEFYLGTGAGVRRQVMVKNRNARVDHMPLQCHLQVDQKLMLVRLVFGSSHLLVICFLPLPSPSLALSETLCGHSSS